MDTNISSSPAMPELLSRTPTRVITTNLNVQSQTAQVNQPVTATANMANRGETTGNYTATLKINGEVEQIKTGKISGNSAVPLEFTIYRDKPGQYLVDINGQQASFTIVGTNKGTDSSRTIPLIGFFLCSIGVIVVSVLIVKRHRTQY
jgi:hypothetical protein